MTKRDLEYFTAGYAKIVTTHGDSEVAALIYREFHIRPVVTGWRITHQPTGLAMPADFLDMESAASAVLAIRRLLKVADWQNLTDMKWSSIRRRVREVIMEHGGEVDGSASPHLKAFSEKALDEAGKGARP